ncbi:VOC family protein [Vibrio hannami]|uniref:VOC family protein n=1 Tax=Vibrio hannami TaxID=2717094 RepID=UPI00240F42DF|nr:VOC family protein [Vibrio hannami]MDG3088608.1 VOC family protein [Vibrio hannami]
MCDLLSEKRLNPKQMLSDLMSFSMRIEGLARDVGIDIEGLVPDHIALRINDQSVAELAHKEWLNFGDEISNAVINGRPIIVIELADKPLFLGQTIECLELPYPAPGKSYPQEGWEHVELVVPSGAESASDFLEELKQTFPKMAERWDTYTRAGIKTKLSSPKGEGERLPNPTVAFKKDGICIKLHPWSLKQIVESEK